MNFIHDKMICFTFENDNRIYIGYQKNDSIYKISFRVIINSLGRPIWNQYLKKINQDIQIIKPDFTRMVKRDMELYKRFHGINL
jgi:hypothetical protein